jgi:2-phosphosulfolactate phosphatase
MVNTQRAEEIITGSFVNAPAIVAYIRSRRPAQVSLVCMGTEAVLPADEDTLCAQLIKDSLECRPTDFEQIRAYLRGYHTARKFFDVEKVWAPERDFDLCLSLGRFNFILKAYREANNQNCAAQGKY